MVAAIRQLGSTTTRVIGDLGAMGLFLVEVARDAVTAPWRLRNVVDEVYKLGFLSLLIICISGLAVGMVLGLQGYNTLERFGATQSVGAVVGLSLVRELGPVLTALLVTGRAGSATAAEIGTMVATEQLDGLRMMSVDPVDYVVTPRAVGMMLVMPLLTALFIVCGIFGGWLVGVKLLGVDSGTYFTSLEASIDLRDDLGGSLLKAGVFGVLVGWIATYRGYTSAPTSAGVSAATTTTVVVASVSVLIFDYLITALWGV